MAWGYLLAAVMMFVTGMMIGPALIAASRGLIRSWLWRFVIPILMSLVLIAMAVLLVIDGFRVFNGEQPMVP